MTGANRGPKPLHVLLLLTIPFVIAMGTTDPASSAEDSSAARSASGWLALIAQAEQAGLPTRFLRAIAPEFVSLEFEDLRAFAAEYHPGDHRMVLNRTLSFNAAGVVLKPLDALPSRDVGTLYHELFHAYLDYLTFVSAPLESTPSGAGLIAFARKQQHCRYEEVLITPVVQRPSVTEARILTERESWEALNETWAVFVGWAVWTRIELSGGQGLRGPSQSMVDRQWVSRLVRADRDGVLLGYYEPEDPAERRVARKRFLAPIHRISPNEVEVLLRVAFEEPAAQARLAAQAMQPGQLPGDRAEPCARKASSLVSPLRSRRSPRIGSQRFGPIFPLTFTHRARTIPRFQKTKSWLPWVSCLAERV